MKKRLLSILLAALLVVSLLPTMAWAEGPDWSIPDWLTNSSSIPAYTNCFKADNVGEGVEVVDISKPGYATKAGIIVTADPKTISDCNLNDGDYDISGTYICLHADAFTDQVTDVTIYWNGGSASLTVYNKDGAAKIGDSDVTWKLNGGTLTIGGTGAMPDYETVNARPWHSSKNTITTVMIESGITSIGDNAFNDCTSLTSVAIPVSVTTIGNNAFRNCKALTSVTIPAGVTAIGNSAFNLCEALTSVTIPAGVTIINDYTFRNCKALTSVTIPKNVTTIGQYAFGNCTSLTSVTIPKNVTTIGQYAFYDCTSLTSVTVEAATPPTLGTDAIPANVKVYVPAASAEAYNADWNTYASEIVGAQIHDDITFEAWTETTSLPSTAGNYNIYLTDDVTLTGTWNVPTGTTNLDLNGHVIKMTGSGSVITIPANATLNLYDCGTTEHYFTVGDDGLWTLAESATGNYQTVTGGVITVGNTESKVRGITVSGTFTMNGGNIVGNTASNGGGVFNNGTFNMNGGSIVGNAATVNGGGVYNNGTFNMNGGNIVGNAATGNGGGGVYNNGTFNMNGGSIVGNTASEGGGVYVCKNKKFTMIGGNIVGNAASSLAGGVFVHKDGANVTLGGTAQIIENFSINSNGKTAYNYYVLGYKDSTDNPIKTFSLGTGVDEPKFGMKVGIKMQKNGGEFTTNATETQVGYFTPDDSTFGVRLSSTGGIELAKLYAITTDGITNGTITTDATENKAFADNTVTITVTASEGYQLKADSLKVTYNDGSQDQTRQLTQDTQDKTKYTFTMPAYAVTVSAEFERIPTPSSGGSSSSTITVPVSGDASTVKVSASVSGSTATVKPIKDADLAKVADGESVAIDLSGAGKNVDTAKIPTETVEKISEKSALTVKLPVATVEFDNAATAEIADQAEGNNIELVVDSVKEVSLNAVQKESVKKLDTALIIDAHLVSNGERLCSESEGGFGGGKATVILPYEIKNNRTAANYSVYYVNDAGKLQKLNAKYDEELAAFVFEIEHFSVYAVAYDEYVMPFVDVPETAYYYDAVKWAVEKEITLGKTDTEFDPNGSVTRAQAVTFLWRAAGKPVVNYAMGFADVAADAYYAEAVRWALSVGITKGTDETHFSPNATCTRGHIVTFLYRYAKASPVSIENPFADVAPGRFYYKAALWADANDITHGRTKTTFAPKATCTRAQVVTFLYRYLAK